MKLFYKYMTIFYNFSPTSSHLHPPQVENCDSNSRLVVDEDDNGKLRPERVNETLIEQHFNEQPTNLNDCNDGPMLTKHCITLQSSAFLAKTID